jgi:hypothetical protein
MNINLNHQFCLLNICYDFQVGRTLGHFYSLTAAIGINSLVYGPKSALAKGFLLVLDEDQASGGVTGDLTT